MNRFKAFAMDFPSQGASVVVALTLIFFTGVIVAVRLLFGEAFPDGYEAWLLFLGSVAGINTAGMVGKRATDFRYKAAGAGPSVNVEAADSVRTTGDVNVGQPMPPAPPIPPTPGGGVRPPDPAPTNNTERDD